ncbi:hypothetical protein ANCCAN_13503 [Ancylostoma caninum]|uniref:Uncharacterized protein n=1 Tax=Ancylostoma caninum TaxID=29170 RepID=A0A368GBB2_ANCCA|nr:hypothetical protein ANCCAN_13503 [Ancylostoma caninum]
MASSSVFQSSNTGSKHFRMVNALTAATSWFDILKYIVMCMHLNSIRCVAL